MFSYFIVYFYANKHSSGFGNIIIKADYKINNSNDIRKIEKYICEELYCKKTILLSYTLLEEVENEKNKE